MNLEDNWMSFLDTGVGMDGQQVARAFAPHVSFKHVSDARHSRKTKNFHRGFKGIGMTFLAYSTNDITIHSKTASAFTKARMQYGHAWAISDRQEPALLVEDTSTSPLDSHARGTYLRVHFSSDTRPKDLRRLASSIETWEAILRTKTAIGQVLLSNHVPTADIDVKLTIFGSTTTTTRKIHPVFLYPHDTPRTPPFRFLDLPRYYDKHSEQAPPTEKRRQDGIYLRWDTTRIRSELTIGQQEEYADQLEAHRPFAYAFAPYQASVWRDINAIVTNHSTRKYLYAGLMIAVNGQRLADIFDINPSRYVTFSKNVFVIVHYHDVKPDHGRKTIDTESTALAARGRSEFAEPCCSGCSAMSN